MDYFKWSGSDVRGFDHEPAAWHASLGYAAFGGRTQVMVPSGSTVRYLGKSPLGSPAVAYHRMYVTFPTNLASGSNVIARALSSDNQQAWRLRRGPNGTVVIDGPTNGLSTSVALAAGTEWRLEWRTSATDLQLRIYNGESTTPFDTRTATAAFLIGDNEQFGQLLGTPALPTFYMRDILITDDGWPGPSPAPGAIVGKRIAIIGDSLTAQSGANGKYIYDEMVARGMSTRNTYLWGVGGKRISIPDTQNSGNNGNNRTTMQNMDDAVMQLGSVDYWLFCLGTNDRPNTNTEVNGYIDTVHAKVDTLTPGAMVTWLTITSKVSASTDDVRLNSLIAAKVAARANTTLADWNAHIRAIDGGAVLPWWLETSDSVHMSSVGYPVRAKYQVDQVQEATSIERTATGTLTLTGSAPRTVNMGRSAAGGLVLSGSATRTLDTARGAVGSLTLTGAAARGIDTARSATGALTLSGTGHRGAGGIQRTALGLLTLAGSATREVDVVRAAAGALSLAGSAHRSAALTRAAVGNLNLNGVGLRSGEPTSRMVFTPTTHQPAAAKTRPRPLSPPVWPTA